MPAMKACTTHHHACACREAAFTERQRLNHAMAALLIEARRLLCGCLAARELPHEARDWLLALEDLEAGLEARDEAHPPLDDPPF